VASEPGDGHGKRSSVRSRPLDKVRHDIRGEKFTALDVVSIAIDQQVDAGVVVLSDQVYGLGDRTEKSARRPAIGHPPALRRYCGVVAGEKPSADMGLFDRIVIATLRVAMSAQYRQLMPYLRNVGIDEIAGVGETGNRATLTVEPGRIVNAEFHR
jgi:hypothetical protein